MTPPPGRAVTDPSRCRGRGTARSHASALLVAAALVAGLRPATAQDGSRGDRKLRSATSGKEAERCEAILEWLGRLTSDKLTSFGDSREQTSPALLYRDEEFRQVFGKRYEELSPKDRLQLHEKRIAPCRTQLGRFRPFTMAVDGPLAGRGRPSPDSTLVVVRRGRQMRAWLDSTVASLPAVPKTKAGFDRLRELRDAPVSRDQALWPSEREFLRRELTATLRVIADDIVAASLTIPAAAAPTMADVAAVAATQGGPIDGVFEFVTDQRASWDRYQQAYGARLDTTLARALATRITGVEATPATLEGALQLARWKQELDRELAPHAGRAPIGALDRRFASIRTRVLEGALPAWQDETRPVPTTADGATRISRRLGELFPFTNDRTLPIYAVYYQPFKTRNDIVTRLATLEAEQKELEHRRQVLGTRLGSTKPWPGPGKSFPSAEAWAAEWAAAPRVGSRDLAAAVRAVQLRVFTTPSVRALLPADSIIGRIVTALNARGIQVDPEAPTRLEVQLGSHHGRMTTNRGSFTVDLIEHAMALELPARVVRGGDLIPLVVTVARGQWVAIDPAGLSRTNLDEGIEGMLGRLLDNADSFEQHAVRQPGIREAVIRATGGVGPAFAGYRRPFPVERGDTARPGAAGLTRFGAIVAEATTSVVGMTRNPVVPIGAAGIEADWRRRLGQERIEVAGPGAPTLYHRTHFLGTGLLGPQEGNVFALASLVGIVDPECLIEQGGRLVTAACLTYRQLEAPSSGYSELVTNFATALEAQRSALIAAIRQTR